MIEFLLLFALGFLTAAVLGLVVFPFLYRRIVRFAEDRLKETVPLSAQEVRAQKDAARAAFAAENARVGQTLQRERDKATALMVDNEKILRDGQRMASENAELHMQISDMSVEAADLRSSVRQLELNIDRLKTTLAAVETDNEAKSNEIRVLSRQLDRVSADVDSLRIDVAARTTEAESLKSRIAGLRDEREAVRTDLKAESGKAREMETRLMREETRVRQLENRLARELASSADKDTLLERRAAEIERLKTRAKEAVVLRDAPRSARTPAVAATARKERKAAAPETADLVVHRTNGKATPLNVPAQEDIRNRAAALSDRLIDSRNNDDDDVLRGEIAEIAAALVAVTARKEGGLSPIHSLLAADDVRAPTGRKTLGDRARERMDPEA